VRRDAIFPALFTAVAALVVVSMFTPKPTAEQLAKVAEGGVGCFRIVVFCPRDQ
jgi:hypothetical protein